MNNEAREKLTVQLLDGLDYAERQLITWKGDEAAFEEHKRLAALSKEPLGQEALYQALSDTAVLIDKAPGSGWCEMEIANTNAHRTSIMKIIAEHSLALLQDTHSRLGGDAARRESWLGNFCDISDSHPAANADDKLAKSLTTEARILSLYVKPEYIPDLSDFEPFNPFKVELEHQGRGADAVTRVSYEGVDMVEVPNPVDTDGRRNVSETDLLKTAKQVFYGAGDHGTNNHLKKSFAETAEAIDNALVTALNDPKARCDDVDMGKLKSRIYFFDLDCQDLIERPEMFPGKTFSDITADTVPFEPAAEDWEPEPEHHLPS